MIVANDWQPISTLIAINFQSPLVTNFTRHFNQSFIASPFCHQRPTFPLSPCLKRKLSPSTDQENLLSYRKKRHTIRPRGEKWNSLLRESSVFKVRCLRTTQSSDELGGCASMFNVASPRASPLKSSPRRIGNDFHGSLLDGRACILLGDLAFQTSGYFSSAASSPPPPPFFFLLFHGFLFTPR